MVDSNRLRALFGVADRFAPAVSPSGDAMAYRVADEDGTALDLRSLETGETRRLVDDLPPIDRQPLYWLPSGDRLVSVDGDENDHVVDLVTRDGDRERLADPDGRAFLYDTEPEAVWYWVIDDEPTLYRHPINGDRRAVASVDPMIAAIGGVDGGRAVITRVVDGDPVAYAVDVAEGTERQLPGTGGWGPHARPWFDGDRLLLSRRDASGGGGMTQGVGVYDLDAGAFAWHDDDVDRPVTLLPEGSVLAVRGHTLVIGGPEEWRELPVDGTAVVSPMASEEILLPDGRAVVARKSETRPREFVAVDVETGDSEPLVTADFAGVDPDTFVAPEAVTYPAADGTEVDAYCWRPDGDGPFPAVVTMYPPRPDPTSGLDLWIQSLVDAGYVVVFAGHRGDVFAAHRDYAAAGEWVADRPRVAGDRVAFYGHSYGGEAALRQAFRHPEPWAAVVAWAGPYDLVWGVEEGDLPLPWKRDAFPEYEADPETWREASPAAHADGLDVPLLALYGRRDPLIDPAHGRRLVEDLPDDAPIEYHEFAAGHGGDPDTDVTVWTAIHEFLDRRLGE